MSSPSARPSFLQQYLARRINHKWLVLATVSTSVIMSTLDVGIVSVAYPSLTTAFSTDPSTVVWVSLGYFLISIGLLLTMGWVADAIGRRRVFIGGMAVWALGLALSASAADIYQLIAYRALLGVASAMCLATGHALMVAAFPTRQRGLAFGLVGIAVGLGSTAGPFAGGLLVDALGWRAVFYTRVPLALLGATMGWTLLDRERPQTRAKADYAGAMALFLLLTTLFLGINQAGRLGISHGLVIGAFVAAVILVPLLVRIEGRASHPILDLSLFRVAAYRGGVVSLLLIYQSWTVIALLIPFLMVNALEMSSTQVGLVLAALSVPYLLVSPPSGWLTDRLGPGTLMTGGVLITTVGVGLVSQADTASEVGLLLLGLFLVGAGTALYEPANATAMMGSVASGRLGMASASIGTGRQVSFTIGYALGAAIFASRAAAYTGIAPAQVVPEDLPVENLTRAIRDALLVSAVLTLPAVLFTWPQKRRRGSPQATPS